MVRGEGQGEEGFDVVCRGVMGFEVWGRKEFKVLHDPARDAQIWSAGFLHRCSILMRSRDLTLEGLSLCPSVLDSDDDKASVFVTGGLPDLPSSLS